MIYTGVWPVTTDGSDCAGRITLPYLCSLLQETATMHADELGWGLRHLEAEGLQWVLSRQWLRMETLPPVARHRKPSIPGLRPKPASPGDEIIG